MARAFLFTTGDGRPTANAFWMEEHQQIIPRVEVALEAIGLRPVWLHPQNEAVCSEYMAIDVGKKLLAQRQPGDVLVDLTTGWNFPEHFGVVVTMCQEHIAAGTLRLLLVCNMEEKAPGYVAARANALICEIMEQPYVSLTVIDQSDEGWEQFATELGQVLEGTYKPEVPKTVMECGDDHRETARVAIRDLRESGGVTPIIVPSSMTMAQGWPNYPLFKKLGLTPISIGSNQFAADMAAVPLRDVLADYAWLQEHGLNFDYEDGGLCEEEIFQALRMYRAKLGYWKRGARGMGTQGQMDITAFDVATDLSESLMMTSVSPGKDVPVVDVTESDCEALWTSMLMQELLLAKYGEYAPIGFHDVRHYNRHTDRLVLLNSGALALDFMTDEPGEYSDIYAVSQNRDVYFLNGGACIKGNMRPVDHAFMFRAHGKGQGYRMQATGMQIHPLTWEERAENYGKLDPWPMGIVSIPGGLTRAVTLSWVPNHSQHCEFDILLEMQAACEMLGVEFHCYAV